MSICWRPARAHFAPLALTMLFAITAKAGSQVNIPGPQGTGFGTTVEVLPNGNFVVVAPQGVGAVYLYSSSGSLISTLTGSHPDDFSATSIFVLANGNFVVSSPSWSNAGQPNVGAVTWVDGRNGRNEVVSAQNSLVGSHAQDLVGLSIKPLSDGDYVVLTPYWDLDDSHTDVGSVTFANGVMGITGTVSAANSLIGSNTGDGMTLDAYSVVELTNHNIVIPNPSWNNGRGAVTWLDGASRQPVGAISKTNSLVGSTDQDGVGTHVLRLDDGNYIVSSPFWDDASSRIPAVNAGAVSWCGGVLANHCTDEVTKSSSLYGARANDMVGSGGIAALSNGHYLVLSPDADIDGAISWMDGGAAFSGSPASAHSFIGPTAYDRVGSGGYTMLADGNVIVQSPEWHTAGNTVGAVTWIRSSDGANSEGQTTGFITASNSLVGNFDKDQFGQRVVALANNNYVVVCPLCDSSTAQDVGLAAFGTSGTKGAASMSNSVVGSTTGDFLGGDVVPLANGNYVVVNPFWDIPGSITNVGAVTWVDGVSGRPSDKLSTISSSNSLVGAIQGDAVGLFGVTALSNGNYVVLSPDWNATSTSTHAGAITWGNGASGVSGGISSSNSLMGAPTDAIGGSALALPNGNYVAGSPYWNGNTGAVTYASGSTPLIGVISSANSLVGGPGAYTGFQIALLANGDYVVQSPTFCGGTSCTVPNAGAITLGRARKGGIAGQIGPANSVIGTVKDGGASMVYRYNCTTRQLIVGRPAEDVVTLFIDDDDQLFSGDFENGGACR